MPPLVRPPTHSAGKLLFLIRGLERGGAERQLVTTAIGLSRRGYTIDVAVFYRGGALEQDLRDADIRVHYIDKRGRWDIVGFAGRLIRLLRRLGPDIVYSYLPTANILAALFKSYASGTRIVWGVRASNVDTDHYDLVTRLTYRLQSLFARRADLIISNSHAGRDHVTLKGIPGERVIVVPNGIDSRRHRPSDAGRRRFRTELGLADDDILVGVVGRLDPMKGHTTFLEAAARCQGSDRSMRFVCVGKSPDGYGEVLRQLADRAGLRDRVIWAGERSDLPDVYNAFDIACSASAYGEGFSNAIGEAMACARPCVVTDVGDAARIVGDAGIVVPPDDPAALADAWRQICGSTAREQQAMGARARARIERNFSEQAMIDATADALARLT